MFETGTQEPGTELTGLMLYASSDKNSPNVAVEVQLFAVDPTSGVPSVPILDENGNPVFATVTVNITTGHTAIFIPIDPKDWPTLAPSTTYALLFSASNSTGNITLAVSTETPSQALQATLAAGDVGATILGTTTLLSTDPNVWSGTSSSAGTVPAIMFIGGASSGSSVDGPQAIQMLADNGQGIDKAVFNPSLPLNENNTLSVIFTTGTADPGVEITGIILQAIGTDIGTFEVIGILYTVDPITSQPYIAINGTNNLPATTIGYVTLTNLTANGNTFVPINMPVDTSLWPTLNASTTYALVFIAKAVNNTDNTGTIALATTTQTEPSSEATATGATNNVGLGIDGVSSLVSSDPNTWDTVADYPQRLVPVIAIQGGQVNSGPSYSYSSNKKLPNLIDQALLPSVQRIEAALNYTPGTLNMTVDPNNVYVNVPDSNVNPSPVVFTANDSNASDNDLAIALGIAAGLISGCLLLTAAALLAKKRALAQAAAHASKQLIATAASSNPVPVSTSAGKAPILTSRAPITNTPSLPKVTNNAFQGSNPMAGRSATDILKNTGPTSSSAKVTEQRPPVLTSSSSTSGSLPQPSSPASFPPQSVNATSSGGTDTNLSHKKSLKIAKQKVVVTQKD